MSATGTALIAYAAWTMLLALSVVSYRALYVLSGKRQAHEFTTLGDDLGELSQRLCRAYYNCCENLPAAAAIFLYAIATQQTVLTDGLALLIVGARIAQSVVHIIAVNHWMVLVRVTCYSLQILPLFYLCYRLITA